MNMSPTWAAWRAAARDWTLRHDPSGCRRKEGGVTGWLMIGVSVKSGPWNTLLKRERERERKSAPSLSPDSNENNTKMTGETRYSKTCHGHYFLMHAREKQQVLDITETPSHSLCSRWSVHVPQFLCLDLIKRFLKTEWLMSTLIFHFSRETYNRSKWRLWSERKIKPHTRTVRVKPHTGGFSRAGSFHTFSQI